MADHYLVSTAAIGTLAVKTGTYKLAATQTAVPHSTSYPLSPSTAAAIEDRQITFTITRSGDGPSKTVYFSTLSGSATYDEGSYSLPGGGRQENVAASFNSGVTSRAATINILSDWTPNSGETFETFVQLSSSEPISTYLATIGNVTIGKAPIKMIKSAATDSPICGMTAGWEANSPTAMAMRLTSSPHHGRVFQRHAKRNLCGIVPAKQRRHKGI